MGDVEEERFARRTTGSSIVFVHELRTGKRSEGGKEGRREEGKGGRENPLHPFAIIHYHHHHYHTNPKRAVILSKRKRKRGRKESEI